METPNAVAEKKKRPQFLTVLCILTFLGSGFGLINALTNYVNADVLVEFAKEAIDQSKDKVANELEPGKGKKLAEQMISGASAMTSPEKLKQNYLLTIISNLITLGGALMMFRQKRVGFWIYVVGMVVLVATPVVIFGAGNLLSLGLMIGFAVIGILFIVLYSFNLKHLR